MTAGELVAALSELAPETPVRVIRALDFAGSHQIGHVIAGRDWVVLDPICFYEIDAGRI